MTTRPIVQGTTEATLVLDFGDAAGGGELVPVAAPMLMLAALVADEEGEPDEIVRRAFASPDSAVLVAAVADSLAAARQLLASGAVRTELAIDEPKAEEVKP